MIRKISQTEGLPFLISNRHIVEGKAQITICMKQQGSDVLRLADIDLLITGTPVFSVHPDPKIDVAVIRLDPGFIISNQLEFPSFDIDDNAMTMSELRANGVDDGSLVHMLGFPLGLVNVNSKLPICRLGCIARMSEAQVKESGSFLVDIQNFPGNSGSPVILRPDACAIQGTSNLMMSVLIGIIHSYIPYEDSLISGQTNRVVEVRSENSGIANAHPVDYIREIIDGIVPRFTPSTT